MAKATQETVDAAILSLQKTGKPVSFLSVRKFIGGGSHPLIMRLIKQSEYYDQTTSEGPQHFTIPRGDGVRIETEAKKNELMKQLELLLEDRMEDAEQRGYASRDDDFAAIEAENAAIVLELEQKTETLEACEQRISSLQHDMGLKTAEIEAYRQKTEALEACEQRIDILQREVGSKTAELEACKRDAETQKRELEVLRAEMKHREDDYKRTIAECEKRAEIAERSAEEKWKFVTEMMDRFGAKVTPEVETPKNNEESNG